MCTQDRRKAPEKQGQRAPAVPVRLPKPCSSLADVSTWLLAALAEKISWLGLQRSHSLVPPPLPGAGPRFLGLESKHSPSPLEKGSSRGERWRPGPRAALGAGNAPETLMPVRWRLPSSTLFCPGPQQRSPEALGLGTRSTGAVPA